MSSPARSVLVALVSSAVVVTAALGWAGWRLLDQQRTLDEQCAGDRAESAANAVAAGIRRRLAEAGERLSGWVANPAFPLPAIEGAVVVAMRGDDADVGVNPAGGLPFIPIAPRSVPVPGVLAAIEAAEFDGQTLCAAEDYRRLSEHPDPRLRVRSAGGPCNLWIRRLAAVTRRRGRLLRSRR